MSDPVEDLEAARARIRAQAADAERRRAAVHELAATVESTRATVRSERGEVAVTASATAVILEVTLDPEALDLAPGALGALLTRTIGRAQRAAAERALAATEAALGEGEFTARLRAEVAARFPEPPEDEGIRYS